jgi:acetyl-CoA decarbonylase/synthase, CODH/ACS complex subunit gamma
MALTGIQIFKLLPKTNCGDCGVPTCLAFAMSLAAGKAELAACPHVSEESKALLSEASAPPIRPVPLGVGERATKVGGETVLYRHEKTFVNPCAFAMLLTDVMDDGEVTSRLERAKSLIYERVGLTLKPELVAVKNVSGDPAKFAALVSKVVDATDFNLILMSDNVDALAAGQKASADRKPLLCGATSDNYKKVAELAKEGGCPVVARTTGLDEAADLTEKLSKAGIKDIVLDTGGRTLRDALDEQIWVRSAALNKKFRPLGFPTIVFPCEMTDNPMKEAVMASILMAKYAGIVVLSDFAGESLFPLLVGRMNVYTDPQRPLATEEGIYEIGSPTADSPVLITSNFSLTYFIVSGEIENSKIPSYLLVKDTEGLSVMTAWAAGKFVADAIAPFVKKSGIADKVSHHKIIIPGYLASESGGLEEELPDWQVQVGPREGSHITAFLKAWTP